MAPERYAIEILPSAGRQLERLPATARVAVSDAIDRLALEPRPQGARLLSGTGLERIWRIAVGSYRVIYEVLDRRLIIVVVRVADRREAYRQTDIARLLGRLRGPG